MLFNIVGKIKGKCILPLIMVIFAGCGLFKFGLKLLDTQSLNLPPHSGFIMSPSSGYITVIDTRGDSVVGRQEVARRSNIKLENIDDFLIHNGLLYVTLHDRQAYKKGSDVLRILDPSSGKVEESKVGWAPHKIYPIGDNLAFVSTDLIYYSSDSCYNYIYNLDTREVLDTIAFKDAIVLFAIPNGDTVIIGVNQFNAPQYFVLYSKRSRSVISSHIPIDNYCSDCAVIKGDNLYARCVKGVVVYSISDFSLKKNIYLSDDEHLPQSMVAGHNKLYITYFDVHGYKKIDVIDTNTNEWIKAIDIPEGGAEYIDYSRSLDKVFAASYTGGRIYKIDPSNDSIIDTIETGDTIGTYGVIHIKDE